MQKMDEILGVTMEKLKGMLDVSTIVGAPIFTPEGWSVIPVTEVSYGFFTGGGEIPAKKKTLEEAEYPFAGGCGAGVSVKPVAFLILNGEGVRLLPAKNETPVERLIEMLPQTMKGLKEVLSSRKSNE